MQIDLQLRDMGNQNKDVVTGEPPDICKPSGVMSYWSHVPLLPLCVIMMSLSAESLYTVLQSLMHAIKKALGNEITKPVSYDLFGVTTAYRCDK